MKNVAPADKPNSGGSNHHENVYHPQPIFIGHK